ncbi:UDP-N-acetylglucosaminyltransferase [Talaromyces stipitatus ATCC 10500]|uniref:protein O-GlcNAc transferase n=1 Tax=Talaromyces stipitatus (strain ATCC 10500 / CBS 375.48 / QM 6759 / NRRL 1006) TaxID=441959 RepID=B8MEL7_TALSN|nr:UDP-N-acetylglucosaminyltransferase [Talaromyces stipitatus ATCC 10500]EED16900.1 UDP-N-acetylglucosaminyltransferase [Talaromyces stipitatus ATCC 10500]
MLPTMALPSQFHPHHHMDRRLLGYDMLLGCPPYNLHEHTNASSFQHRPFLQQDFDRVATSIPRSRNQYPHPVQRPVSLNPDTVDATKVTKAGEHTLRRKTPNGTLAAGYDGTPGDRAIQPPAAKHIIVSSLDSRQQHSSSQPVPSADSYTWQPIPVEHVSPLHYQNFPPAFQSDISQNHTNNNSLSVDKYQSSATGPSWVRSLTFQPGVDSVLHQTPPVPQLPYYLQNGPSIPTVLPSSLQSPLGPTAPVGTGPYGPYWPDGAYIPYRPAAQRDSRFIGPTFSADTTSNHLFDLQTPMLNQSPSYPVSNNFPDSGFSWNQLPSSKHDLLLQHSKFPPRHSHHPSLGNKDQHRNNPPYHVRAASGLNNAAARPLSHTTYSIPPPPPSLADPQSRVQTAEFKKKVLAWAHGVYVDLLACLHHARKNSVSNSSADGKPQRNLKPAIFPKPPRQPGLDFSGHIGMPRHNSYPSSRFDMPPHGSGRQVNNRQFNNMPISGLMFDQHTHSNSQFDGFHTIRKSSATSLAQLTGSVPSENTTMASAASALEMLSHLCNESNWEWIDGMLLGGCLAYGLGDYQKATRWYSRIIARDSRHVEAISNLAATFLALDQKDEALQHWLRAVKLRPSYFEAVEHLINLLCTSHRGREAVNIIKFVENSLRVPRNGDYLRSDEHASETESDAESTNSYDRVAFDYDNDLDHALTMRINLNDSISAGFASSGFAIPGSDNGRILALVHAKGNMLYALGDNAGAAAAFEEAILIASGRRCRGITGLIKQIVDAFSRNGYGRSTGDEDLSGNPLLLPPEKATQTATLVFPPYGYPPGLEYVAEGLARKAAISTTSNSLLSLAKIYQDGMSSISTRGIPRGASSGVRDILALYYLSLSLQPSPSTANNVGILLASLQHNGPAKVRPRSITGKSLIPEIPGVAPDSGIALALAYYSYGLTLDPKHAHLYTNLGSLWKDIGQLHAAIRMYELAVQYDGNFDIALANLANAVKDAGRINDAIVYYKRAVKVNPDFAEAVCGLANALNSVCNWTGRGGVLNGYGFTDQVHVDDKGMPRDVESVQVGFGWMKRVADIVDKQLKDGETWGRGMLTTAAIEQLCAQVSSMAQYNGNARKLVSLLQSWAGQKWEGSRIVRLVERIIRSITWQWYQDFHVHGKEYPLSRYRRPQLPAGLSAPNAPTVLPFHTFTCPLSAKQIRHISQRNGLRISSATLRSPWLPQTVYPPPNPPQPYLKVGYVSSDFNNHPLAHLMQSVFGFHNPNRVKAYCYATTASDNSTHRQQIEREAPQFYDASRWPIDRLVDQIVRDGIHILVNLNGYTRGARNEVFAARPAPIQMSFMGFAGTLGAEWCDYILADELSIPRDTLSPGRREYRIEDHIFEDDHAEEMENWMYGERIVYTRDTFFCCDHRQSAPDNDAPHIAWEREQERRWKMRKELFPSLPDDAIILGNFNQLYKIEPTTFRTWLRILSDIPKAVLWLLRFPELGEQNLKDCAVKWANEEIASRIIFTDVAPKQAHIARAQVVDLFLDTPECNAHTTAADILWSGTPMLTYPRYKYKMCSRMASSILSSALPDTEAGHQARKELIAISDEDYRAKASRLCRDLHYPSSSSSSKTGRGEGRLVELRKMLFTHRWQSRLFDTRRWVNDLENAYERVWSAWVKGEEGDIWL